MGVRTMTDTDVRRTILDSLDAVGKIYRKDLVAHVAETTDHDADTVTAAINAMVLEGELYCVQTDDGQEIRQT